MIWVALLIAVVLVGLTVAAILGRIDGSLAEPTSTVSFLPLPQDRLTEQDIDAVRFDTAFRGYRMDQVDEVLGRLTAEIGILRAGLPTSTALVPDDPDPDPAEAAAHPS
jgi:DivIVA domain-containing protein